MDRPEPALRTKQTYSRAGIASREWLFPALVVVCLFYLAYRYPLMLNASSTSGSYSDTPWVLSVGKYVLVCALVGALVVLALVDRKASPLSRSSSITIAALLLMGAVALARGVFLGSIGTVELGIFLMCAAGAALSIARFDVDDRRFKLLLLGFLSLIHI